jgi:hypothetical protein
MTHVFEATFSSVHHAAGIVALSVASLSLRFAVDFALFFLIVFPSYSLFSHPKGHLLPEWGTCPADAFGEGRKWIW